jgi:hypothetical protein
MLTLWSLKETIQDCSLNVQDPGPTSDFSTYHWPTASVVNSTASSFTTLVALLKVSVCEPLQVHSDGRTLPGTFF